MSKRDEVKRYKAVQLGFNKDSEKLLHKYSELETHSYAHFAKIWQEMAFSLVYAGKSNYDEFRHYTEVFLFESKKYYIYSKNIYLKTGAFYLMYGLYYKQPIKGFVKIRLTKNEFQLILEYVDQMKQLKEMDPLYVYCKMMVDDVFDFVYTQTMLAPDLKHFKENFVMVDNTFEKDLVDCIKTPLLQLTENKDIVNINDEYTKALREYTESHKDLNLTVFQNNILEDIKKIIVNTEATASTGASSVAESDIGTKRTQLKQKAARFKK